ncbi:MAG: DivIVA domain-containing protein [Nocardioidaceae bacterium]
MLTTADLTGKTFTTTRLREGYEMAEVDQFLAAVGETLAQRDEEIRELRKQLVAEAANGRAALEAAAAKAPRPEPAPADVAGPVRESSTAAARLLEIATVNADRLVAEAKAHAGALVANAHVDADRLTTAARAEADQLTAAARDEASRVTADLAQRKEQQAADLDRQRQAALAEVAEKKATLEAKVERLQRLESENRTHLLDYFTEQIDRLQESAPAAALAVVD